jgi:hypothetical protein
MQEHRLPQQEGEEPEPAAGAGAGDDRPADAADQHASQAINANATAFNNLVDCLGEAPLTQYGDPAGSFGYVFDDGTNPPFNTTALDLTESGDPIGGWALFDLCNPQTVAGQASANGIAPSAEGLFSGPQSRTP